MESRGSGKQEMIQSVIAKLSRGEDLSTEEMTQTMESILSGGAKDSQIAAFLMGLRLKGETVDEIVAAAAVLRRIVQSTYLLQVNGAIVAMDRDEINIDQETMAKTCSLLGGTHVFSISTAAAFVVAGCGLKIAKSGARIESTYCGSGDVLSALEVNLDLTVSEVERCVEQVGIGFFYAPLFHTPLIHAAQAREDLGIRTVFNLLGPLANPARAEAQVLGVYQAEETEPMAQVLNRLGAGQAFVVFGQDTLDELSITGPTRISHLKEGAIKTFDLTPEEVGLERASVEKISGGDPSDNARIIKDILGGQSGPRRDVILLNAAAALVAAGRADDLKSGIAVAAKAIDSGQARSKLDKLVEFTAGCGVFERRRLSD